MSNFVDWLKTEWAALEQRQGKKYSARQLSIETGLSPNTLYPLLKNPEVKPSPETCHKLATFFNVEPLLVLEVAGHVSAQDVTGTASEFNSALKRSDLQQLLFTAQELSPTEVQLVQQLVDRLRVKRQEEATQSNGSCVPICARVTSARPATPAATMRKPRTRGMALRKGSSTAPSTKTRIGT